MKIILAGYPGSQRIVPASKYLVSRYLPGFDVTYLNYSGPLDGWSKYVAGFLVYLTDDKVIFALDDYLIAAPIDMEMYQCAEREIWSDVVSAKLCKSTYEEHRDYSVTTQYTIWNREYLIALLRHPNVNSPWEFELNGSKIMNRKTILRTCIDYFTNSSLSARWEGVNLEGLKEEDVTYIKSNGLIS